MAQVAFETSPPEDLYGTYIDPQLRDCPLSDKGIAQTEASAAKAFLLGNKIDLVLVSPLKRAM
jgi:hypothetical protein